MARDRGGNVSAKTRAPGRFSVRGLGGASDSRRDTQVRARHVWTRDVGDRTEPAPEPNRAPPQPRDNAIGKGSEQRAHEPPRSRSGEWRRHSGTAPRARAPPRSHCGCLRNPLPSLGLGPPDLTRGDGA